MTITTTVTWADLRHAYDDELSDLADAYAEIESLAADEYPEGLDTTDPADDRLQALKATARQYDQSAKEIQKNQHVLETLDTEYGEGAFEIKMLSGNETMAVDTELKMLAADRDVDVETIQHRRNALVVDKATVDAPDGIPADDAGSPTPSDAPNPLTFALWEQVERLNNAGDVDFTPAGVAGDTDLPPADTSAVPTDSGPSSSTAADSPTPE